MIANVYDWVGQAVTSHSGSSTDTCRYMVQVISLNSTDFSHSHGPAKTGDCTHLPDLPRQLAISLYICIILCKGYSAFLIKLFHSSCKSAL